MEYVKDTDMASDFLPEVFSAENDVAVGEVLRSLRHRAKNNTLPQIWQDFLLDCGYDFNIPKLRGKQQTELYAQSVIELLKIFVDEGINLNNIPQRAKAKEVLPNKFSNSNDVNIGTILQYARTKYKASTLPQNLLLFLLNNNFHFEKFSGRTKQENLNASPNKNKKTDIDIPKLKNTREAHTLSKDLPEQKSKSAKETTDDYQQTNLYAQSTDVPRKKVHILKLLVANGVDLNCLGKDAMVSQLLPIKTITREEDFCVGKIIRNAKLKFKHNELKCSTFNILTKLGVDFYTSQTSTKLINCVSENLMRQKLDESSEVEAKDTTNCQIYEHETECNNLKP